MQLVGETVATMMSPCSRRQQADKYRSLPTVLSLPLYRSSERVIAGGSCFILLFTILKPNVG